MSVRAILALACLGVGSTAVVVRATPYASEISISGNTVTFDLNEAADSVSVKIGGVTQSLSTAAGFQSFTLPSSTTPFSIQVDKNSGDGWMNGVTLQVGTDSSLTAFNSPRGVAVNQNPGPYFGRIYVSNSATASSFTTTAGTTRDSDGRGIYVLNADQSDALGQGNTALTGGIPALATGTSSSAPYRLTVGPDNNLYIGDSSTTFANIYRTDPNVSATSGTQLLYGLPGNNTTSADADNHGGIFSKPIVKISGGNLSIYAIDAQLGAANSVNNPTSTPQFNAIRRYDVGPIPAAGNVTGPAAPVPQTLIANPTTASTSTLNTFSGGLTTDLAQGPKDGRFYYMETRGNGNADLSNVQTGVYVVDPATGNTLFDSLVQSRAISGNPSGPDLLAAVQGVAISPDNKYMALIVQANNTLNGTQVSTGNALDIVPLTATIGGVSGLPDLANMKVITDAFPNTAANGRDIAFDAAGNLYAVSSGQLLMREFSAGGASSYTTSFDGTNFAFGVTVNRLPGDVNGDGFVNSGDINAFIYALSHDAAGFAAQYPTGNYGNADVNGTGHAGDTFVNAADINPFIQILSGTGEPGIAAALAAVPEPTSLGLLGLGAVGVLGRRRGRRA